MLSQQVDDIRSVAEGVTHENLQLGMAHRTQISVEFPGEEQHAGLDRDGPQKGSFSIGKKQARFPEAWQAVMVFVVVGKSHGRSGSSAHGRRGRRCKHRRMGLQIGEQDRQPGKRLFELVLAQTFHVAQPVSPQQLHELQPFGKR